MVETLEEVLLGLKGRVFISEKMSTYKLDLRSGTGPTPRPILVTEPLRFVSRVCRIVPLDIDQLSHRQPDWLIDPEDPRYPFEWPSRLKRSPER